MAQDSPDVELFVDAHYELGEGPSWHENMLWWVDIQAGRLHRREASGKVRLWDVFDAVGELGAAVPAADGRWLLCGRRGLAWLDVSQRNVTNAADAVTLIHDPELNKSGNRFNDAKVSPDGRLFAGTMATDGTKKAGALYRIEPDLSCTKVVDGVGTSNGLAWSADGRTMYYNDTPTHQVDAFDYDPATGAISNRRPVIKDFGQGRPDGMTIDSDDQLWVCLWDGHCVAQCDPKTGKIVRRIAIPAKNVTSACFGGPDYTELYVTTAGGKAKDKPAEYPKAGGIFRVKLTTPGKPVTLFKAK